VNIIFGTAYLIRSGTMYFMYKVKAYNIIVFYMDNVVVPYVDAEDSSDEGLSTDSSEDEHSHLLSNNVGVHFSKFANEKTFMNMEDSKEYREKRDRLFTPEITKRLFTVKINKDNMPHKVTLEDDLNLPTKNIIGFKILKSSFVNVGDSADVTKFSTFNTDLSIPEIPEIACDKDDLGANIIARIPLRANATEHYTHQFLELSLIDRYFFPIPLNTMTFTMSTARTGFLVFEISYLNDHL
tara:strand:+ start:538 stop:1257 length:720 start_codon:yes stop_codon:yes gene_type:complete